VELHHLSTEVVVELTCVSDTFTLVPYPGMGSNTVFCCIGDFRNGVFRPLEHESIQLVPTNVSAQLG
jgi:hypothetical protein